MILNRRLVSGITLCGLGIVLLPLRVYTVSELVFFLAPALMPLMHTVAKTTRGGACPLLAAAGQSAELSRV